MTHKKKFHELANTICCFIQIHPQDRVYYTDEKFREATTKEELCELATKAIGNIEKESGQTVC